MAAAIGRAGDNVQISTTKRAAAKSAHASDRPWTVDHCKRTGTHVTAGCEEGGLAKMSTRPFFKII